MNLFARIDAWLIAGPFQTVVDISQRKPEWWAQQSLIATLVLECIRRACPNKHAHRLEPEQVMDIARLANLRMWEAYHQRDLATRERTAA